MLSYVLERAKAPRFMGNMLQKPSFLMKPWSNDSANSNERVARQGDRIAHKEQNMNYAVYCFFFIFYVCVFEKVTPFIHTLLS